MKHYPGEQKEAVNERRSELQNKLHESYPRVEHNQFSDVISYNRSLLQRRYFVCFLTFLGMFVMYALRISLSVAVVEMVSNHSQTLTNGSTITQPSEFTWSVAEQGYILSSFFYGYAFSEFISGWLAGRFGGATVFGLQVICAAIATLLIPFIASFGSFHVFLFRVLTGIFEGGSLPCLYEIWSQWAPLNEKTTLVVISMTGTSMANILCFFSLGIVAVNWGWRFVFYIPGVVSILWCIVWFMNVTDRPETNRRISRDELNYIRSTTIASSTRKTGYRWKALFTSVPVWANVFSYFCLSWGFFFFFTELPSYFNDVWKMNVNKSGLWLTIPYIILLSVSTFCSILADYLIIKKKNSVTKVRKIFHAIAGFGSAISYLMIAYCSSAKMALIFIGLCNCFQAFYTGSIFGSPLDIAPSHASIIMGMMTTAGSIAGILAASICGIMLSYRTLEGWRILFKICGVISTLGTLIYLCFSTGKLQSWAKEANKREQIN